MRELERQISHDRKLRDFMKLKSQERHEDQELVAYRKQKGKSFVKISMKTLENEVFFLVQRLKSVIDVDVNVKNIRLKPMKQNSK